MALQFSSMDDTNAINTVSTYPVYTVIYFQDSSEAPRPYSSSAINEVKDYIMEHAALGIRWIVNKTSWREDIGKGVAYGKGPITRHTICK